MCQRRMFGVGAHRLLRSSKFTHNRNVEAINGLLQVERVQRNYAPNLIYKVKS